MARWKLAVPQAPSPSIGAVIARAPVLFLFFVAAFPIVLILPLVPLPLVWPVMSLVSLTNAAVVSLLAWRAGPRQDDDLFDPWDLAGACAFVGFGAGMLSKPEHVLALFGLAELGP
jgi:hypothetical protein